MSDPNSTIKTFTVSGEAASAIGGTRKRKKRTTATMQTLKVGNESQTQKGGTSPGTTLQVEANKAPGAPDVVSSNFQKSTETALSKTTTDSTPAPAKGGALPKPPPLAQEGGAKPVKVILEKKKKSTRVVLSPTKVKKLNPTPVTSGTTSKTRKVAKKIRMSLNGFGKRVTRAHSIRVEAKKSSLEQLKKTLVEAKLIKADSKAPENVLRQMYSDYMMLKNRAL